MARLCSTENSFWPFPRRWFGGVGKRLCIIVWTRPDSKRHVISMRKANDREQKNFKATLDEGWFANADLRKGGKLVRRGRPKGSSTNVFMKKVIAGILLAVLAFALGACAEQHEWHQKMTVTVATPSGDVSGASVIKIVMFASKYGLTPESRGAHARVTGEAAVVEVAPGRYLFALLNNVSSLDIEPWLDRLPDGDFDERMRVLTSLRKRLTLETKYYPLLVTFTDIDDPKTVQKVDPKDAAASLGAGYRIKSITLEITDESVTKGKVESVLDWLTWPNDKWIAFAEDGREPMRIQLANGLTDSIPRSEFIKGRQR